MSEGRLIGIAGRKKRRDPMEESGGADISLAAGLEGDCKGAKFPARQITVLAREAWEAAVCQTGEPGLPWTVRRANLLVAGVDLPRAKGAILRVGPAHLEITGQTYPCVRMEEAQRGLLKALAYGWRGGVTCRVIAAGRVTLGDPVELLWCPPQRAIKLPG